MFDITFTTPISLFIAMAALSGVAIHDTKIDKLASSFMTHSAISSQTDAAHVKFATDPHTHVERMSFSNRSEARIAPRLGDQKKHVLQKNVPKGGHAFDGYRLPLA